MLLPASLGGCTTPSRSTGSGQPLRPCSTVVVDRSEAVARCSLHRPSLRVRPTFPSGTRFRLCQIPSTGFSSGAYPGNCSSHSRCAPPSASKTSPREPDLARWSVRRTSSQARFDLPGRGRLGGRAGRLWLRPGEAVAAQAVRAAVRLCPLRAQSGRPRRLLDRAGGRIPRDRLALSGLRPHGRGRRAAHTATRCTSRTGAGPVAGNRARAGPLAGGGSTTRRRAARAIRTAGAAPWHHHAGR